MKTGCKPWLELAQDVANEILYDYGIITCVDLWENIAMSNLPVDEMIEETRRVIYEERHVPKSAFMDRKIIDFYGNERISMN